MDVFALALKITEEGTSAALSKLGLINAEGKATELELTHMTHAAEAFYAALAGGIAAEILAHVVEASGKAQESIIDLKGAVENAGASFDDWSGPMEAAATKLGKLTKFSETDARGALGVLTTATGDAGKAVNLLGITADVAAKRHIDLDSAARMVGRIANGNNTAFRQLGLTVAKGADGMAVLNDKFRGFAEKEGQGVLGQVGRVKNAFEETVVALGDAILGTGSLGGVFEDLIGWLEKGEKWITANAEDIGAFFDALVDIGKLIASVVTPTLYVLWMAFKGGQVVIVELYSAVLQIPDIFKRATGETIKLFGDFIGSMTLLSDRMFGTHLTEKWADPLRQFGQNMSVSATRSIGETQRLADATIDEIFKTAAAADEAVEKKKRYGGHGNTQDDAAAAEAAKKAKEAQDKLIASYGELAKAGDPEGIAFLTLMVDGLNAKIHAGITDVDARADAVKKLAAAHDILNAVLPKEPVVVDWQIKPQFPTETEMSEEIKKQFAGLKVNPMADALNASLGNDTPKFDFLPFVDEAALAAEETAAKALASVQQIFDGLGSDLSNTIGETIGGAFTGGFKGAGKMALAGLGSIFKTMGQSMLSAGIAMIHLLPAMTNPITGGPALVAAGAILLGIGAILGGIATGSGANGGAGGSYASGYGQGINPYGPTDITRSTLGPTSVSMGAGDLVPRTGDHYTIIGTDDPRAQRDLMTMIDKGKRRNL